MFDLILNWWNGAVIALGLTISYVNYRKYDKTKYRPLLTSLPGVWTSLGLLCTFCAICFSLHGLNNNSNPNVSARGAATNTIGSKAQKTPVAIDPMNLSLEVNQTYTLHLTRDGHPIGGARFTSSNDRVASVNNDGVVTAKMAGSAQITAAVNGVSATCDVTIDQKLDIIKIINNLIPAFTTSIIGLLGALLVTIASKIKFAKEEVEENNRLENTTPEEYIRNIANYTKEMKGNKNLLNTHNELLTQLINLHKEEEKKNREYNERLNNNISRQSEILEGFINEFVNRMDGIFEQMRGAIQQQVQNFGEEQFAQTSQVLTSITERLSNVSNRIIENQRQSVEMMMNNTNTEIGNITTAVTEVLGNLTSNVQESLATLNTQQSERLNAIISNYDSLATRLSEQNTDFASKVTEQMQEEYLKVQEHNVQSLQQMVDLRTAYQEITSDVLTSTLAMNEKATTDLRESMSGFVTNIQTLITTQCSTLSTAISKNVESLNRAYQFIESLVAEIRQNYDQAVLAYGDAVNVAHRTNESSEKLIAANNTSLQAVEETNNRISEVLDILVERQENIEQLTKQIGAVSGAIVELQRLEKMLNKITNNK